MSKNAFVSIDGLDDFLKAVKKVANGGFAEQMGLWLESMGMEFLDLIQDEIIRAQSVETRNLLNSFKRGDSENIWTINKGGLSLEVGTNLKYATYVNDGHFTIDPKKGKDRRWVPGYWSGDRFVHDPSAETGMLLKFTWIDGTGYWDNALAIFDRMFEKGLERKLQEWLNATF